MDKLIAAVIAREVAEDNYFASEYRWSTMDVDRELGFGSRFWRATEAREAILQAMIAARLAALVEADAAGLLNLFDPIADEALVDRMREIAAFVGNEAA